MIDTRVEVAGEDDPGRSCGGWTYQRVRLHWEEMERKDVEDIEDFVSAVDLLGVSDAVGSRLRGTKKGG